MGRDLGGGAGARPHAARPRGARHARIESGLIFAGYEFDDQVDPFEAGIGFAVDLKTDEDFVGRAALEERAAHPQRVLVGLELDGNETAGHGDEVYAGRQRVGVVTSGTRSPILKKNIALARVAVQYAELGTTDRGRQARRPPEADQGDGRPLPVLRPRQDAPERGRGSGLSLTPGLDRERCHRRTEVRLKPDPTPVVDERRRIDEFVGAANAFRELCESAEALGRKRFLTGLIRALSQLQAAAVELPHGDPVDDKLPFEHGERPRQVLPEAVSRFLPDDWGEVQDNLHETVDGGESLAPALVADDLGDIYDDIVEGFDILDAGFSESEAVWHWHHGFWTHWGYHAAEAQRVLHYYVALHGLYAGAESDRVPAPSAAGEVPVSDRLSFRRSRRR